MLKTKAFVCLLTLGLLAACSGTRLAYQTADTPEKYAYVLTEHYASLVSEAAQISMRSSPEVREGLREAEAAAYLVIVGTPEAPGLVRLARLYQETQSAEAATTLQAAIDASILRLADFVNAVKGAKK